MIYFNSVNYLTLIIIFIIKKIKFLKKSFIRSYKQILKVEKESFEQDQTFIIFLPQSKIQIQYSFNDPLKQNTSKLLENQISKKIFWVAALDYCVENVISEFNQKVQFSREIIEQMFQYK
ncbi:hypothetical protein pb186bvf_015030 [Paramecium bursaria]